MAMRKDIPKIRPLEEKVTALGTTVNIIQKSLSTLEGDQLTTNSKLDKIVNLMTASNRRRQNGDGRDSKQYRGHCCNP
jgi:hypothetical protein